MQQPEEHEFSFKSLFVPFTTLKAIQWIIFIGLVVYFNGLFNSFVLDDTQQIVDNVYVHSLNNFVTFFTGSTFYNGGANNLTGVYYKPLLSTFFSLIYTFFGANYFVFHLFQLFLHIASACFLFLIFKQLFKKITAFVLSLIFLIHPAISETVFYIAAAQDTLFFFFGILGFYLLTTLKSKKYLIFVILLLLLSIFSKETGILFFVVSLVYTYIYRRNLFMTLLISSVSAFICYFLLRMSGLGFISKAASAPVDRLDFYQRLIQIPKIFLFYLRQYILPVSLSSSYQWIIKQVNFSTFYLPFFISILFILSAIYASFVLYNKKLNKYFKLFIFFFFWLLIGITLHIHIYPLDATVADRWFYFPIVGLLGMTGIIFEYIQINKKYTWILITLISLVVTLLGVRTFVRSFDWRDEYTLALHDNIVSPNDYYLENIISINLSRQGKFKEAKYYAEKSIQHFPFYTNINTLGTIYTNLGDYKKSKELYFQALRYGNFYMTYDNLGGLTLVSGTPKENVSLLVNIIKRYPNDDKLWLYLAIVEYKQKHVEEAKTAATNAYRLNQNYANAYYLYKISNNQPIDIKIDTTPGN